MNQDVKKVILHSQNGYDVKHDELLQRLISEKILLFCAIGRDCELWHDIMDEFDVMDELSVANDEGRDFFMITTWHEDESLDEVVKFAKSYDIEGIDNEQVRIIEV